MNPLHLTYFFFDYFIVRSHIRSSLSPSQEIDTEMVSAELLDQLSEFVSSTEGLCLNKCRGFRNFFPCFSDKNI